MVREGSSGTKDIGGPCVRAAPYCSTPAEDLCFNNYCDIAARVRKANQCRCVRGLHADADGRTVEADRSTDREPRDTRGVVVGARGERERGRERGEGD